MHCRHKLVLVALTKSPPGNVVKCREMVLSIPQHVQNVHTFPDNEQYTKCPHGLLEDQTARMPWIPEGSFSDTSAIIYSKYADSSDMEILKESLQGRGDINIKVG